MVGDPSGLHNELLSAKFGQARIAVPLGGQIRGLAHDEADIEAGSNVLEVTRSGATPCFRIGIRRG